jgi:hypothetical protein
MAVYPVVSGNVTIPDADIKALPQLSAGQITASTRLVAIAPDGSALGYILSSQVTGGGGGGGGGLTQSYVGRADETARTAWRSITPSQIYAKKITLATAGLIVDVQGWFDADVANVYTLGFGLWSDSSGEPNLLLASSNPDNNAQYLPNAARWHSGPIGRWLVAGDYWIGFITRGAGAGNEIGDIGTGTDRFWTAGNNTANTWLSDAIPGNGLGYNPVSCGRDLLLRATVIR